MGYVFLRLASDTRRSGSEAEQPSGAWDCRKPSRAIAARIRSASRGFCRRDLLLDRGGRKEAARAAFCCWKSENEVSLPHEQSVLFAYRIVGLPLRRFFCDSKSARKNRPLKVSCNPLISLDSDERIQGNPRESQPYSRRFRSGTGRSKKIQTGSTNGVAPAVDNEQNRRHPNAQRSGPGLVTAVRGQAGRPSTACALRAIGALRHGPLMTSADNAQKANAHQRRSWCLK